jgi:hypothetical protein
MAGLAHPSRGRPSGVRSGEFSGDTHGPASLAQVPCSGFPVSAQDQHRYPAYPHLARASHTEWHTAAALPPEAGRGRCVQRSVSGSKNFVDILDATPEPGNSENCAELLDLSEPYEAPLGGMQQVASLNRESSNQLYETFEESNDYLERQRARSVPGTVAILIGQC